MASKSKIRAPRKDRKSDNSLAQFGLLNIPSLDLEDNEDESDVDENELESELEAILSGKVVSKPKQRKKPAPTVDIEKLAADCLKDSDDDDDDANLSGDEELLAELKSLAPEPPPSLQETQPKSSPDKECAVNSLVVDLEERLKLYEQAVETAKQSNDSAKSRRYARALKTLQELLKSAKSGKEISEDDIPPILNLSSKKISEDHVASLNSEVPISAVSCQEELVPKQNVPETNISSVSLKMEELPISVQLATRRDQYKLAALKAKKSGNTDAALIYVRIAKKFDAVIEAEKAGHPIDLSNMPPPPTEYSEMNKISSMKTDSERMPEQETGESSSVEAAALAAASEPEDPGMFSAPPPPSSVIEALQQRLDKYISTRDAAQAEGNSGKVRRLQRIIKQYQVAIKDFNAGKIIDFDELPTPPGFAPIPKETSKSDPSVRAQKPTVGEMKQKSTANVHPVKETLPANKMKLSSESEKHIVSDGDKKPIPPERREKLRRSDTSTVLEKQLDFLLERQKLFRQAAVASKRNGDIQQAKEYLRMSKGFDSMIEATKSGLPIDATTIPTPPQLDSDFVVIEASECIPHAEGSQEELFECLERDLSHQIEVCTRNKDHFLRLGDVSSASKFEKLGLESRKDLSVIQHLKRNGEQPPRLHYETRLFSMVQCHTDLGDNDLEVTVERGINLPGKPDELDSYVRIDFPIPPETPQRAKTHTIRDTNNPIFQEEFKFEINRKSRSQVRHFKRQSLKLEVFSKGGFLRSDTLLGTVSVKLVELESKCSIHDSFDLMDGRRACGGKLEVKIRIRDPLFVKQVEEVREKWLVIGS